jgi:hypothetical protein
MLSPVEALGMRYANIHDFIVFGTTKKELCMNDDEFISFQ